MPRRRRVVTGDEPVSRQEFDALKDQVRRVMAKAQMGLGVSPVLSGDPDVDDSYLYDWDGNVSSADQADNSTTVGGFTPDEIPYITDGSAPASSPTPEVSGGPRFLSVKWTGVANPDPVTYEVHVSTTTGFTPSGATLAGTTPGGLAFIYREPDGTPLEYSTTYYVKIVATDDDGSAAASAQDSAMLDPNGSNDILAGAITAEHFEAVMAMASTMIAGVWGGTNVQMGFGARDDGAGSPEIDPSFVGIRAYDGSGGTDPVFRVDASDGTVQVKGRIFFGTSYGSKLTRNDMIQVAEQTSDAFANPNLEQSFSIVEEDVSSVAVAWPGTPVAGNLLIVAVHTWDATGNASNTFTGYTSVKNNSWASTNGRQQIFIREAVGDGSDNVTLSFSKNTGAVVVQCFEYSGVATTEDAASATESGTSGPAGTGTTGTVTQKGLVFATIAVYGDFGFPFPFVDYNPDPRFTSTTTPIGSGYSQIGDDELYTNFVSGGGEGSFVGDKLLARSWAKVVTSGTHVATNSTADLDAYRGSIISFDAKTTAVESADANSARLYTAVVDGVSLFHSVDESGTQRAVALGAQGQRWDFEIFNVTVNINGGAEVGAHTGGSTTKTGVTGVVSGDKILLMGTTSGANYLRLMVDPTCATSGEVIFRYFNADGSPHTPGNVTVDLLVIHR